MRVLVAEDEEHLGAMLEAFLGGRGHAVRRVRDGRAAVDALLADRYDVALVDVMMPELDGLDVLRAMSGIAQPPEAILMTGSATTEVSQSARQLGAFDCLTKPYRMADVDALVRRAAAKGELERERARLRRRLARLAPAPSFVTEDERLLRVLAAGAAGFDREPLLVTGARGGGRRTLARWLHARAANGDGPAVVAACTGDAIADARELLDGDASALDAAAGGALVVADADRLDPALGERLLAAAAERAARLLLTAQGRPAWAERLGARHLAIPPLAERPGDVGPLARHFASLARPELERPLEPAAVGLLESSAWPGDAAELRLVVELAAGRARGAIGAADVAPLLRATNHPPPPREPLAR